MIRLAVPEQLKGPWQHALILTYGADIPFFENALWSQFGARCRNKIILADGQRHLESCASYARSGLVRHLNHRYIAEGIFAPHAAHAKLILLTNPQSGRLLVGSGNLTWQGYASGGELFTQYEYNADAPGALNAFLAVRELVDGLLALLYISTPAARRIRYLWEETPWFFKTPVNDWQPVRHNLTDSFLSQLEHSANNEPVEELWVLSPFYDREATALERLLVTLEPRKVTLLVQPGYTSVDPIALQRVFGRFAGRYEVRSFSMGSESPYVHAKLFLLKLPNRAICLQGSPNLSQVAMLLTVPRGNIELANLLNGSVSAFDELLHAFTTETVVVALDELDLCYEPTETSEAPALEEWHLVGGEWHSDQLHMRFRGAIPDLRGASLLVANQAFPLDVRRQLPAGLKLRLSSDAVALLGRPVPVAIRWGKGDQLTTTNPIFVCNRAALAAVLEITGEGETLPRIGSLDLDDAGFEQLLADLEASLVIDRRSVWILAGESPPVTTDEDDEALRLDYVDVDYEMLRQHPRLQQYVKGDRGGVRYARSRLQVILSAITDHFRGLMDLSSTGKLVATAIAELEVGQAETEEEREREEEEQQRRRQSQAYRLRRILRNFIRRYLRGIRSPDFQELAGFEVMAQNYIIFSHVLWRLFAKEWAEPEFVAESLFQTWRFFWGSAGQVGYYQGLNAEQQARVLQWVREHHTDAELLAALYHSASLTRIERAEDLRFALRDFWHGFVVHYPFDETAQVLEEAWYFVAHLAPYEPPRPTMIVDELHRLADFETEYSFLRTVENQHSYRPGSCRFENVRVRRAYLNEPVTVKCLVASPEIALADQDIALAVLREWMRFEKLDYYRIACPDCNGTRRVFFYETFDSTGVYWARDRRGDPVDIKGEVLPSPAAWEAVLSQLRALAEQLDAEAGLPVSKVTVVSSERV